MKWLGQPKAFVWSVNQLTFTPLQLSEALPPWAMKLARLVARAGTADAQSTVTDGGQLMVGGVVSPAIDSVPVPVARSVGSWIFTALTVIVLSTVGELQLVA